MTIIKNNNFGIKMRTQIEIFLSAQFYCSVSCSVQTLTITCYLQLEDPLFLKNQQAIAVYYCD